MEELSASLNLSLLDDSWVNEMWSKNFFSDEPTLPDEYCVFLSTLPLKNTLKELSEEIVETVSQGALDNMQCLMDTGFDLKRILCILDYQFSNAIKYPSKESWKLGLAGVQLYYSLLSVPDSHVYCVFQCHLFDKAMKLMLIPLSFSETQSSQSKKKHHQSHSEENYSLPKLSPTGAESLLNSVCDALQALLYSLEVGKFCQHHGALEPTAKLLSNLAQYETNTILFPQSRPDFSRNAGRTLSLNAYHGMVLLCDQRHGDVKEISRVVMKYVFDVIQRSFQKEFSHKEGNVIRENACSFVLIVVKKLEVNCHNSVLILLQFLCMHCPERAEPRYRLVENVFSLLLRLNEELFLKAICLFLDLSCMGKSGGFHQFTVAIVGKVLMVNRDELYNHTKELIISKDAPDLPVHLHRICFLILMSCISDHSGLVIAKALTILADYLERGPSNKIIYENLKSLFITPYKDVSRVEEVPCKSLKNIHRMLETFKMTYKVDSNMMLCGRAIMNELLDCVDDDKVLVRKAALQCIVRIFKLNEKFMAEDALRTVSSHCQDFGIMVRKVLVQELTDLLLCYPSFEHLQKEWSLNIITLVVDPETKVVEKVVENIARAVFENVVEESLTTSAHQRLPWQLISLISDFQLRKHFLKACGKVDKNVLRKASVFTISQLLIMYVFIAKAAVSPMCRPRKMVSIIKSHIGIGKTFNTAAWIMLMCIAECFSIQDPKFVLDFYHSDVHNIPNVSTFLSQLVMEVLWFSWKNLPQEEKSSLEEELNMDLNLFKMPVSLISRAIDIRHGLYKESNRISDDPKELPRSPPWALDMIKKCEESIDDGLRASRDYVQDEEVMQRSVNTLSNTALYCPGVVQSGTIIQLQFMLMSPEERPESYWTGSCSTEMKAGLIIALGKLSLQNERRARDLVGILGKLLSQTNESILKNNSMVCLTDLCIRYASLVESLLPEMCVCLKDPQRTVRENTLVLLIHLLQEDYLKMRERLVFNLLTMLNDVDRTISAMTRAFFVDCLLQKNRKFFLSHFAHSIFYYNRYKDGDQFPKISLSKQEEKVFNLQGSKNMQSRHDIYRFVLSHLGEEMRILLSQILCIDICKQVVDDRIALNESGQGVLKDALFVMSCDEMRHTDKKESDEDADDMENDVHTLRKEVFSEMRKKHVVEIEIPTLAELYRKLATSCFPLAKDVIRNLRFLAQEEKVNLHEILKGENKSVLKDLQYNSRMLDEGSEDSDSSSSSSNMFS